MSQKIKLIYQAMKEHEENLCILLKEASVQRPHAVWFQIYHILESQTMDTKSLGDCQGLSRIRMNRWKWKIFRGVKLLCVLLFIIIDTCHSFYISSNP